MQNGKLPDKTSRNGLQRNIVERCSIFFQPQLQGNDKYV